MTELELERLLKQAAEEARALSLEAFPDEPEPPHAFSDEFEQKMQALLAAQQRPARRPLYRRLLRRAAVFLLVGLTGASALMLGVDAWREQLFEMVEQKYADHSEISYRSKEGMGVLPEDFELTERQPAYLPEGYRLTEQILDRSINWSTYTNAEGEMISFNQSVNAQEGFGMGLSINTEGAELIPFDLNGDKAYKMSNMGTQYILWNDDVYNYMVLTALPMDEALRIAGSVQNVPADAYHPPRLAEQHPLTPDYTPEQARENGDMVLTAQGAENTALLDRLLENAAQGRADIIRIADFTGPQTVAKELYFDGFRFHYDENHLAEFSSNGYNGGQVLAERTGEGLTVVSLVDSTGERIEICRY